MPEAGPTDGPTMEEKVELSRCVLLISVLALESSNVDRCIAP